MKAELLGHDDKKFYRKISTQFKSGMKGDSFNTDSDDVEEGRRSKKGTIRRKSHRKMQPQPTLLLNDVQVNVSGEAEDSNQIQEDKVLPQLIVQDVEDEFSRLDTNRDLLQPAESEDK